MARQHADNPTGLIQVKAHADVVERLRYVTLWIARFGPSVHSVVIVGEHFQAPTAERQTLPR